MDHVCRLPGISLERYTTLRIKYNIKPTEENVRDAIKSRSSHIVQHMFNMKDVDVSLDYDKELLLADDSYILYLLQSHGYVFKAYHLLDGKKGKYISQYFIHGYPSNSLSVEFILKLACLYEEPSIVARLRPEVPIGYIDSLYTLTTNREIRRILKPKKFFSCFC